MIGREASIRRCADDCEGVRIREEVLFNSGLQFKMR